MISFSLKCIPHPPICIEVFNWADAPLHYLWLTATSIHLSASSEEKQPMITIKMLTEESACFTKLPNKPLTALNDHWPPDACSFHLSTVQNPMESK